MLQVRGAAAATAEREARALAALERSGAERNAAAAARERLLQEREEAVSCTRVCQQGSMCWHAAAAAEAVTAASSTVVQNSTPTASCGADRPSCCVDLADC
jgi:hypothetical protein